MDSQGGENIRMFLSSVIIGTFCNKLFIIVLEDTIADKCVQIASTLVTTMRESVSILSISRICVLNVIRKLMEI